MFVEYIFGITLVIVFGFLGVLFYYDVSPYTALYKLAGRFVRVPTRFEPTIPSGPYRRPHRGADQLHQPVILNLETSDGSGQACHPDVVYIPRGFGEKKWPYWMVCTPYPYKDSRYENPEIFASYDGVTWTIPPGVNNPLVLSPSKRGDHNSDPDILFYGNELWLFFRKTSRSKNPNENTIFLMKSKDGVRWSVPVEILRDDSGEELLSPAVIHDGSRFVMWTIELHDGSLKLMRRATQDTLAWDAPTPVRIIGLPEGRFPWHIDVIQDRDRLSALLVSCSSLGGKNARIHYAYSDDGLTWFAEGFLFQQAYEFEANAQYRGSLRRIDQSSPEYELWYSASSSSDIFSIAHVRLEIAERKIHSSIVRNEPRGVAKGTAGAPAGPQSDRISTILKGRKIGA